MCCFSSGRAFPRNVHSGFAIFENLDTVEVKRCGEDSLVGRKIPRMLILTAYTMNGWKSGRGGILLGLRVSSSGGLGRSSFLHQTPNYHYQFLRKCVVVKEEN